MLTDAEGVNLLASTTSDGKAYNCCRKPMPTRGRMFVVLGACFGAIAICTVVVLSIVFCLEQPENLAFMMELSSLTSTLYQFQQIANENSGNRAAGSSGLLRVLKNTSFIVL